MHTSFRNRAHAGRLLARRLSAYARCADGIVLGLPRGGVPVADVVAKKLALSLDVLLVRKLSLPGYPEYGVGAIAADRACLLNTDEVSRRHVPAVLIDQSVAPPAGAGMGSAAGSRRRRPTLNRECRCRCQQ